MHLDFHYYFSWIFIVGWICEIHGSPPELRLLEDLLVDYVTEERPVLDSSKPVVVKLTISLQQIINLNEKEETLEVSAWLRFTWLDENLRWEPLMYGNVTDLRHPVASIWTPDVLLYNSVDSAFDSTYKVNLLNYHTGKIDWVPPGIFKISCKLDIYWFPFDRQACVFKFGSWSFSNDKLKMEVEPFDLSEYIPNGEWIIENHTANVTEKKYDCCAELYEDVKFTLYLKRRTLYYSFNLILPCLLIMVLVILGFTVCPETCEKVGLQISVFLAIWIFMTVMNAITPQTSEALPLLGVFFQACMVLSILATSFTVYVQSYHFRNHNSHLRMGFWMRYILLEIMPWILGMKVPKRQNTRKTIKESWQQRMQESDSITAFDYADGTYQFLHSMGDAMKATFDELIFRIHNNFEDTDHKAVERLRVLQRIYDHVKIIREREEDSVEEKNFALEWRMAAMVVDRLCLIAFGLLILFTITIIAVKAPYLHA